MVNLKNRFAQANNNFVVAVIIIPIFIMNIVIKNRINNILLKKKEKKIRDCPKDTLFQTGFEPATFEFSTYLPNYRTCPNDLGYPSICVFRCFLMHLVGDLAIIIFDIICSRM